MVEDGKQAPDFELKDADEKSTRLKDLKGCPLVLYFYPKDDTSGCTAEAKGSPASSTISSAPVPR